MRITAIIVNYRTPDLVIRSLEALARERATIADLTAMVVDNASGDNSVAVLSEAINQPPLSDWVRFLPLPVNGGFGWGNNQAMLHILQSGARPDAFFLLNPDTVIERGALHELARILDRHQDAGVAGSQLLDTDGSLSASAFRFPTQAHEFLRGLGIVRAGRLLGIEPDVLPYGVSGPVDWVTGASFLIRTRALEQCGMFDTGFFLYYEEVELMHRLARHGWKTYHCPESRVVHMAGASTGLVGGKAVTNRAPPDYLFHSRNRYFALTLGKHRALLANLAWLAGYVISCLLTPIRKKPDRSQTRSERQALLRIGLRARRQDAVPAVGRTDEIAGHLPSWMNG